MFVFLTLLSELAEYLKWAVAGLFGALFVSRFHKDELSGRRDYLIFVLSGAAIAHFLTGWVASYLDVSPSNMPAIGFLLGSFGGSVIQAAIRAIKTTEFQEIVKLIWPWGGRK